MTLQSDKSKFIPRILSIAGTDPSGGAGMQADLKVFSAMKAYGMSVVTAVFAQNTQGVRAFQTLDASFVAGQIDSVFEDIHVDAVKIGMVAKSGDVLLKPDAIEVIRSVLIPMSTLITPNLPEAAILLNHEVQWSLDAMYQQSPQLLALGCGAVLLKGGHLDVLACKTTNYYDLSSPDIYCDSKGVVMLEASRFGTTNNHGTGCTLSAAIAALLPKEPLFDAIKRAKNYLNSALFASSTLNVGKERGPLHHFCELWDHR